MSDAIHRCHALGCTAPVPPRLLMCRDHWHMVPDAIKARVYGTYRPGQELTKDPSPRYYIEAARAICVVAWCEGRDAPTHGLIAEPGIREKLA